MRLNVIIKFFGFGHSGLECFKLFSRTRFYEHVGFAFLVRRVPKSDWKTDPYDLISVEDVGNEEGKNKGLHRCW